MLKKNDIVRLEIVSMTNEGSGVGRYEGIAVFVPFTAIGDVISCRIVKVYKNYCYGIIEKLIEMSDQRCEADCDSYGKCGGCCFRHMDYSAELMCKQRFAAEAFERIGKLSVSFEPIIADGKTSGYRNKAQFPIAADNDGTLFAGFYARRSHRVIRIEKCALLPDIFSQICNEIIKYANDRRLTAYDEQKRSGMLRHIFMRRGERGADNSSEEIMVCIVVTDIKRADIFMPLADIISKKFPAVRSFLINENPDATNVILGKKSVLLYGREYICDRMCGIKVCLSLNSFYQINTPQAERLYKKAAEYASLSGSETLLDMYCGTGTIGLSMAKNIKKLIGVEIVGQAVENARLNARINGFANAEFICADAQKAAALLYERGERPNVIIADPARKGCKAQTLSIMAKMQPERIVMISCNPATAARDCAILSDLGYKIDKCACADLFPRTEHVECVVGMSRKI